MRTAFVAVALALASCGKSPAPESAPAAEPAPVGNADPNAAERYAGGLQRNAQQAQSVSDRANAAVKRAELSQKELEAEAK